MRKLIVAFEGCLDLRGALALWRSFALMMPFALLTLVGCTKPAAISNLVVTGTDLGYKGGTVMISFSANRSWSAGTATGWSTVSARSGDAGDVTLSVDVSESYETEARTVDVVLKSEDAVEKVRISQDGRPVVDPDTKLCKPGSSGGHYILDLHSNVDYSVEIPKSVTWLLLVSTKAMTAHTAEFEVDPNPSTLARSAEVILHGGASDTSVTFTQDGVAQVLSIVHCATNFSFPTLSGSDVAGTVSWGFGDYSDPYKLSLGFTYPSVMQKTVTFTGKNVTAVTVSDVSDILELDFSRL